MPNMLFDTLSGESVEVKIEHEGNLSIYELKLLIETSSGIDHLTQAIYDPNSSSASGKLLPDDHEIDIIDQSSSSDLPLILMVIGEQVVVRVGSKNELIIATADTTPEELLSQLDEDRSTGNITFRGRILERDQRIGDAGVVPRLISAEDELVYAQRSFLYGADKAIIFSTLRWSSGKTWREPRPSEGTH
jgi:hypothetical protein